MRKLILATAAVPVAAAAYTIVRLLEISSGAYRDSNVYYTLGLGAVVLALAVGLIAWPALLKAFPRLATIGNAPAETIETSSPPETSQPKNLNYKPLAIFIATSIIFVAVLDTVGYLIAVTFFLVVTFYTLGLRRPASLFVAVAIMVAIVHFAFVEWFMLPLPEGWLKN